MGRGRRYSDNEPKLNVKKVVAVIIAILVVIMFIILMKKFATPQDKTSTEKKATNAYYVAYDNSKWGVINSQGETVISPMYDEMITIPMNGHVQSLNASVAAAVLMYEVFRHKVD